MPFWKHNTQDEINRRIYQALDENVDYYKETILGVPASQPAWYQVVGMGHVEIERLIPLVERLNR